MTTIHCSICTLIATSNQIIDLRNLLARTERMISLQVLLSVADTAFLHLTTCVFVHFLTSSLISSLAILPVWSSHFVFNYLFYSFHKFLSMFSLTCSSDVHFLFNLFILLAAFMSSQFPTCFFFSFFCYSSSFFPSFLLYFLLCLLASSTSRLLFK